MSVIPYINMFPHADESVLSLELAKKTGNIPKGSYLFLEAYCQDKGCDCRRVEIFVMKANGQPQAVIGFGFDPDDPYSGPYLDDLSHQVTYATDLLEMFVEKINHDHDWLQGMYDRYRQVRKQVDGKPYRGQPFPKPGSVWRVVTPPPDDPDLDDLFADAEVKRETVAEFIDRSAKEKRRGLADMDETDFYIVDQMINDPAKYEELAALLPRLIPRNPREEERMQLGLDLLRRLLEMIRHSIENQRPAALEQMEKLQSSLAHHIFSAAADINLSAHVTRALLEARVEILPSIIEANRQRMLKMAPDVEAESRLSYGQSLGAILRKAGCLSPFEGFELLLDTMILNDAEIQIALCRELLDSRDSFVRDTAALMLFHPYEEVRTGVAALLAKGEVRPVSPEALRRLIVSRNWFPAPMRSMIDETISNARRARVECARLAAPASCVIMASTIDGAGAQSFMITVGSKKRQTFANILWKQGHGVIDSFVREMSRREIEAIMADMPEGMSFLEVQQSYLDCMVCHALSIGNAGGKPPHLGLLQVAEAMGNDRWRPESLDANKVLAELKAELERLNPALLTKTAISDSLARSASWLELEDFADAWFEDDIAVDNAIRKAHKGKKINYNRLANAVLEEVLESRRAVWGERLLCLAVWLRLAQRPPIPWEQMLHLAGALADGTPLKKIPLMFAIAEVSVDGALARGVLDQPAG